MAKLVDARIASGIKTTLRERPLKKGWTAEDQQLESAGVITTAVDMTATELFPDRQRLFHRTLLQGKPQDWPIAGGSDITGLSPARRRPCQVSGLRRHRVYSACGAG
ncbi:hypothetical protein [Glycomyces arizonensis]|uniref:hypothetical protein n=1 Tax=Glycomyces arizonensis TaxID=256035 RepID=UPI00040E5794|nr:hypothetical protein [Glycomyces arizonensis]